MLRHLLFGVCALLAPAAGAQTPDPVAAGALVAAIGGCTNCHTRENGPAMAGGDPLVTPYGTFFAPNITADPETGIGDWSLADFRRAMREGRAPDGTPYYPAFPYTSYHRMTDEDLAALFAYLRSLPAVRSPSPPHELRFPYRFRSGLSLWQWLFHRPRPFAPDPARDALWNRGAYLVLGPGHCGECHTPRGWFGQLDPARAFTGNPEGPEGVRVPDITADPERGIGGWSLEQIVFYLEIGMRPDGDFAEGAMAKIIDRGTSRLPAEDRLAIATYLKSLRRRRRRVPRSFLSLP